MTKPRANPRSFTKIPRQICTYLENRYRQDVSQDGEKDAKN